MPHGAEQKLAVRPVNRLNTETGKVSNVQRGVRMVNEEFFSSDFRCTHVVEPRDSSLGKVSVSRDPYAPSAIASKCADFKQIQVTAILKSFLTHRKISRQLSRPEAQKERGVQIVPFVFSLRECA